MSTTGDTEGTYLNVGPLTYQVQISRQLNPDDIEDQTTWRASPAGHSWPEDQTWFGVFLRVANETKRRSPQPTTSSSPTPRATSTSRCRSAPQNLFSYQGGVVPPNELIPAGTRPAQSRRSRARWSSSSSRWPVDNRPLELVSPTRARARPGSASTSRRAGAPMSDALEAVREHVARRGRGRVAAGAGPTSSTPTATRGETLPPGAKADEPRVGVRGRPPGRRAGGDSPSARIGLARCARELGGAGLAGDATPAIAAAVPVPLADDRDHHRSTVRATRGLVARVCCGAAVRAVSSVEARAAAAQGDRRGHHRHLQRGGLHAALADRRRADREVIADLVRPAGSCSRPRRGRRGRG